MIRERQSCHAACPNVMTLFMNIFLFSSCYFIIIIFVQRTLDSLFVVIGYLIESPISLKLPRLCTLLSNVEQ